MPNSTRADRCRIRLDDIALMTFAGRPIVAHTAGRGFHPFPLTQPQMSLVRFRGQSRSGFRYDTQSHKEHKEESPLRRLTGLSADVFDRGYRSGVIRLNDSGSILRAFVPLC
jgi:hypothetical protein